MIKPRFLLILSFFSLLGGGVCGPSIHFFNKTCTVSFFLLVNGRDFDLVSNYEMSFYQKNNNYEMSLGASFGP